MAEAYPWLKALHILAVIAWMAGLLYLPRLFVYHAGSEPGSEQSETFKVMERRLYRGIMMPAMVVTWAAGLLVAEAGRFWADRWLWAKLLLVALMTGFHFWLARRRHAFAADRNRLPARTYRAANEMPTLLLIGIILLVVFKPF